MAELQTELSPAAFTTFGSLLRFLRRRARLTQRELSIGVGYNFGHISRLEAGQRFPDPSIVSAIFIPALALDNDHAWAARLIELAEAARDHAGLQREEETATEPLLEPIVSQHVEVETATYTLPLLVTKLYLPRARSEHVARSHLLTHLNQALEVPLTLVSAPAGFGKTTLLADWIDSLSSELLGAELPQSSRTQHFQVAWLTLDEGDNDPVTFLRYVVAALQTVAPTIGSAALALAQLPQLPSMPTLMRVLLNDLATLSHETVLVLDDYHVITTPAIHSALQELLDHLPPMLHVVVATRVDPPLPLAHWRARRQLVELRAADLRFSTEEAETFLTEVMDIPLSAADIAALETRTEGWIAGLQLTALAMHDCSNLSNFIHAFTGNNRFVVDYLAAEVFERQPPHLQTFLLQTSILDQLCGPLCDAMLGFVPDHRLVTDDQRAKDVRESQHSSFVVRCSSDSYSQLLLTHIEQANLFLIPLDDDRRWYRYHHLFGELLYKRLLRGVRQADIQRLHERASAWYEGQGLVEGAMHHAVEAEKWTTAARLIDQQVVST